MGHKVYIKGGCWELFNAPYHGKLGDQKTLSGKRKAEQLDEIP